MNGSWRAAGCMLIALASPLAAKQEGAVPERPPYRVERAASPITVDGMLVDLPIRLPRGSDARLLRFDAPGYESYSIRVDGAQDRKLLLPMRKLAQGSPPAPSGKSHASAARGARSSGSGTKARVDPKARGEKEAGSARDAPATATGTTSAAGQTAPPPLPEGGKKKLITDF